MRRGLFALAVGVVIAGSVISAPAQTSPIVFKDKVDFDADAAPSALVASDLNKDSKTDIAVCNSDAANVVVLLGDGVGGFTAAPSSPFSVGDSPMSIATADLNGDGNADLVSANDLSDDVSTLLGSGNAALFNASVQSETGAEPEGVVVADFDGDHKLDIATADLLDGTITVQFGKKDGTFERAISYPVADGPVALAVGDVVGDSALDLVVSAIDAGVVVVLTGKADGTFQVPDCTQDPLPALCLTVGASPSGLAVADLNGDTKLDIVVANEDDDTVSVLLNNGSGGFSVAIALDAGLFSFPLGVAVADFDGDHKMDIVSVNSGNDDVAVFRGNGDGTFEDGVHFTTGGTPLAVAVGDANGDHRPDLFTANSDTNDVSVLLNDSAGSCTGDCDGSGMVSVDELVTGVNIALGNAEPSICPAFDKDKDGHVTVDELVIGVNNALNGCTQ